MWYDEHGEISYWSEEAILPSGQSEADLKQAMHYMMQAFERPLLTFIEKEGRMLLEVVSESERIKP